MDLNNKNNIPIIELSTRANSAPIQTNNVINTETSSDNKCDSCSGSKCCTYTTVSIDTPRSIREFDNLLWHVSHFHTHAFKDADGWCLLFYAQCQHLQHNGFCGIYETRPFVCREHDNDDCEYDMEIDEGSELYFKDHAELDDYCRNRFKNWDKRFD